MALRHARHLAVNLAARARHATSAAKVRLLGRHVRPRPTGAGHLTAGTTAFDDGLAVTNYAVFFRLMLLVLAEESSSARPRTTYLFKRTVLSKWCATL